jgi:hypothetical protein
MGSYSVRVKTSKDSRSRLVAYFGWRLYDHFFKTQSECGVLHRDQADWGPSASESSIMRAVERRSR